MMYLLPLLLNAGILTMIQPTPGKETKKARFQRLSQSPNFRAGKFHNQTETSVLAPDASYWKIMKQRLSGNEIRTPKDTLPVVIRDLNQQVNPEKVNLTWFGHSTVLLQVLGKNILIDPVFSKRASPFQFAGPKNFPGTEKFRTEDLPPIDYLLISHDHYDHLDSETISKLAKKVRVIITPLGVGKHLQDWGVPAENIRELDWWDEMELEPSLFLAATPARHFSGRGLTDRFETLWCSYVIKTKPATLYLGADSGYGPHFKQIGEKYGPFDLTMLECGQYNTSWPNIHMMPEETAQAHLDLKGKILLPIHWGKFSLALHSWTEPMERLLAEAGKKYITVALPKIGELFTIGLFLPQEKWWLNLK
jgi:L-ascorbate metabolism protein UlaG (beta-lactamase superfamily)